MKTTTKAPAKKKVAARKRKASAVPRRSHRNPPEMDLSQLSREDIELMNAVGLACARSVVAHHEQRVRESR